jgi:phytoene dehydrogenase-like protein
MTKYDAIVVGSGAAGMTAGIALAREGYETLIVEKAPLPGGLMRNYTRRGIQTKTGVHLVSCLGEGEILWKYFKYLGVLDGLTLIREKDAPNLEIRFPGMSFRFANGGEAFGRTLVEAFPGEREAVERFLGDMKRIVSCFPMYASTRRPKSVVADLAKVSLADYLRSIGASEGLTAVISAVNPFHGVPPADCPLSAHCLVLDSFAQSCWRIDERERSMVDVFEEALRSAGGKLIAGNGVRAFNISNGKIAGVVLDDGRLIEAERVIFTGHPKDLFKYVGDGVFKPIFEERVKSLEETCGCFGVLAAVKRDAEMPGRGYVISYDSLDTSAQYGQRLLSGGGEPAMIFAGFYDTPGESWGLKALAVTPTEEWSPWKDTTTGARGPEYEAAKKAVAAKILVAACRRMNIDPRATEIVDAFSPLSIRDFTNSPKASAYGVAKSLSAGLAAKFFSKTSVEGLFLAGQNIFLPGVVGTVISALSAVSHIVGFDRLMDHVEEAGA